MSQDNTMGITRSNYEAYFLDYYENILPPEQVAELMVFLQAHPDLNAEFESFHPVEIRAENITFEPKNSLKKKDFKKVGKVDSQNYEHWMVSELEGDLSEKEVGELKKFMAINPDARLEYHVFKKTRLQPDDTRYRNKGELKKNGIYLIYRGEINMALAIAATVLIFLAIYLNLDDPSNKPELTRKTMIPAIESISLDGQPMERMTGIQIRSDFADKLNSNTVYELPANDPPSSENENLNSLSTLYFNGNLPVGHHNELVFIPGRDTYNETIYGSIAHENDENNQPFFLRFVKGSLSKLVRTEKPAKRSLLEYTVDGYNLMADRDVDVEKQYDADGNLVAYHINGELFKIGRKVIPPGSE